MNDIKDAEYQRIGDVLDFMVDELKLAGSRKELAKIMGLSESLVSLVANNRQPVSEKFLDAICRVAPTISREWIQTGNGEMIKEEAITTAGVDNPTIMRQQELIKQANETLDTMIAKGYTESLISRQIDAIATLQKTLDSMQSKSHLQGGIVIGSTVDSYKDNNDSLNNSFNTTTIKRRGRKTNAAKAKKAKQQKTESED